LPGTKKEGKMIKCVYCGKENEPIFTYCLNCGRPLEQSISSFKPRAVHGTPSSRRARCIILKQDGSAGETFELSAGVNAIGSRNAHVLIKDDPRVADEHAIIDIAEDQAFVQDLGSRFGTFVRIKDERILSDGEEVRIGHALFRIELRKQPLPPSPDRSLPIGSLGLLPEYFGRFVRLGPEGVILRAFLLTKPQMVIGRTQGDILLPDDPFVSSKHCALILEQGACRLKDLGSTNGCYVRIKGKATIKDGDCILVGRHVLKFEWVTK
jgi:pSer/pThr/pTyr-binding forkhead associated (FHA) protein